MFNVNRVTLLGNATRDPETHVTKSGSPVTALGLVTVRHWTDEDGQRQTEAEYHRLVCYKALAEFAAQRVRKGTGLYIEGRLHTSRWETAKGERASRTEIIVDRLVLLSAQRAHLPNSAEPPSEAEHAPSVQAR